MYNITIIFTRHEELGKCNSRELFRIFEELRPEVIFEELPPSSFENYYIFEQQRNLETDTIKMYCNRYRIPHIAVDRDIIPDNEYFLQYGQLFTEIEKHENLGGFILRSLVDKNRFNSEAYGFEYLNSIHCQQFYIGMNNVIENGVKKLNNEKLNKILKSWQEINDLRENEILENIYLYCKENEFGNAILTIGAAHSQSIIRRILGFEKLKSLKLNWKYYRQSAST